MGAKDIAVVINHNPDTGMYVGQVVNVPGIICQANNIDQLNNRLKAAHDKYIAYLSQKENIVQKQF